MKSKLKWILLSFLLIPIFILGFDKYRYDHSRNTEWVTESVSDNRSFIEFRPNIVEINKVLIKGDITLENAVLRRLQEIRQRGSVKFENCSIFSVQGNLEQIFIVQLYCYESENAS